MLLAGVRDKTPLNQLFWIEFDTSNIQSESVSYIPNPVRWTFYNYCGVSSNGRNFNCTSTSAAFPFTPQEAFDTTTGIPEDFITNRDTYYYLTRISYGFYIATIFFVIVSLFFNIAACFSRLGAALSSAFTFFGLLFGTASAAMQTAAFVLGRNKLNNIGASAKLGVKMHAFAWTVVALLLLSFILLTFACCSRESGSGFGGGRRRSGRSANTPIVSVDGTPAAEKNNGGFFGFGRNSEPKPKKNYASSFERTMDPPSPHPMSAGFFKVNKRKENDASSYYAENEPANPVR